MRFKIALRSFLNALLIFQTQVLLGEKSEVTRLCSSGNHIAVGYADGNVQVFDLTTGDVQCVFAGHKSTVTVLTYDSQGHKLFSGSKV